MTLDFRAWRIAADLSYQEAADTFGKALSTIQKWERDGLDRPTEFACRYLMEHPEAIIRQRHVGRPRKVDV